MRQFILYFFWAALSVTSLCSQCAWGMTERWHTADSQSPQGFHWYNQEVESARHDPSHPPLSVSGQDDPARQMAALRTMVRAALDRAILYPSVDNATQYLALNNLLTKNASDFSLTLQQALLLHPEMNYTLTHPTQSAARKLVLTMQDNRAHQALKQLAMTQGCWFFYRGKNPIDQLMAKTVMSLTQHYHMAVVGISIDGKILPIFPINRMNHGQAKQFKISATPALLLVNPGTHQVQPVAYGVLSAEQLLHRFEAIATGRFNLALK